MPLCMLKPKTYLKPRIILLPNKYIMNTLLKNYFMLFSTCWIIFLTMFPPILPASFADISPL